MCRDCGQATYALWFKYRKKARRLKRVEAWEESRVMKLKVRSIHGHGDQNEEYVILDCVEDCDLSRYLLTDSTYSSPKQISNKLRHLFWFPSKAIKKGDIVVVYTKSGVHATGKNNAGTPVHYYYWGLGTPVWNDTGDCAVLFELNNWQTTRAK